ncbi:unnamed protein product [Cuscuta epithymum]|uniref:Uncharacterized protein n=1 Tax=Cuscuta epithymum TaxID=186058 RepID=A0AAV0DME9_9ASTE|nr:unnamed protein product [Cuscuta epithymum]
MDLDNRPPPHHRTPSISNNTGELLVCFASRSSSSMKLSKSILSPGRSRDPSVSLSNSLSRRLRNNGSIKAGQASPMFPKKRGGSAFENPEPSSPKVTCIGQVRVKTKKKVKHAGGGSSRSLSNRRNGDLSFRKRLDRPGSAAEEDDAGNDRLSSHPPCLQRSSSVHYQECVPHRNQRWVHLPLTICEALRAFGAEFSCLFPCRSSCFSANNERGKEGKENGSKEGGVDHNGTHHGSCGAVFARWLVALQDGEEGGKGGSREIQLVVAGDRDHGEEEEEEEGRESNASMLGSTRRRRHVFEGIDLKDESFFQVQKGDGEESGGDKDKGRVSICIPPKNALLLMRCRSDPMKMAALTNRFWETSDIKDEEDNEGEEEEVAGHGEEEEMLRSEVLSNGCAKEVSEHNVSSSSSVEHEEDHHLRMEETSMGVEVLLTENEITQLNPEEKEVDEIEIKNDAENMFKRLETNGLISSDLEEIVTPLSSSSSELNFPESSCETEEKLATFHIEAAHLPQEPEEVKVDGSREEPTRHELALEEGEEVVDGGVEEEEGENVEEESNAQIDEKINLKIEVSDEEAQEPVEDDRNVEKQWKYEEEEKHVLPDCLLLMMCEPKLSMEVSKETWVCSTDFIRCIPPEKQQVKPPKTHGGDAKKRLITATDNPTRPAALHDRSRHLLQPRRSSCSLPPRSSCSLPPRSSFSLPPRSSCSLPAVAVPGVSMASMIEQKLVNAVAYEPFVLTRCKSEPMRTAAAKLAPPEPCCWKNSKLEAKFGFGAAGIGF